MARPVAPEPGGSVISDRSRFQLSTDPDLDTQARATLGRAQSGAADAGEVIATAASVHGKDHAAWFAAWRALGDRLAGQADASAAAGHP
ncbi:hypothetical protein HF998_10405, partial [Cellulomonas hominis]|nr:hypothetical protein [Cellulomonas hominis]